MCECGDVRVIGYKRVKMCEWSGHKCASGPVIMCECGDVRVVRS